MNVSTSKIAFLLLFFYWGIVRAETNGVESLESVKLNSENSLSAYQKKSVLLQEREREVLSYLYKMTRKQRRLATFKAEHLQKREKLESDIADLEKNIEFARTQIKVVRQKIASRTRNLYRINAPTIFQSIFGSQSISEMDRNARILYKLSKSEMVQLREFRGLKNILDQQQLELEKKLISLETTQKNLEKQEKEIKKTYYSQMKTLNALKAEDRMIIEKFNKLKSQSGNNSLTIYSQGRGGLYEKKGQLDLPVAGAIQHKFGLLPILEEKVKIYHKGWFVATPSGKEVYPVHAGTVAFVGTLDERQNVIILDHGDHFYSVYANLGNIKAAMGDRLNTMDALGFTGASRLFGDGLYFEIRHFSQSEDPAEWFDESRLRISSVKESNL